MQLLFLTVHKSEQAFISHCNQLTLYSSLQSNGTNNKSVWSWERTFIRHKQHTNNISNDMLWLYIVSRTVDTMATKKAMLEMNATFMLWDAGRNTLEERRLKCWNFWCFFRWDLAQNSELKRCLYVHCAIDFIKTSWIWREKLHFDYFSTIVPHTSSGQADTNCLSVSLAHSRKPCLKSTQTGLLRKVSVMHRRSEYTSECMIFMVSVCLVSLEYREQFLCTYRKASWNVSTVWDKNERECSKHFIGAG